jgi:CRP-like cAMP-binding protein
VTAVHSALVTTADQLGAIPLFADLDASALADVAAVATEVELKAGHVFVQPGQAGSGLFVIQDGCVTVEIGARRIDCAAGECIGELSLLADDIEHTARVSAASDVRCLAIRRDDFTRLLHNQPQIAVNMLRALAHRLAETDRLLAR